MVCGKDFICNQKQKWLQCSYKLEICLNLSVCSDLATKKYNVSKQSGCTCDLARRKQKDSIYNET